MIQFSLVQRINFRLIVFVSFPSQEGLLCNLKDNVKSTIKLLLSILKTDVPSEGSDFPLKFDIFNMTFMNISSIRA